ncbi:hypothetical protein [Streptomyces sp. NPDC019208]|uniref:hypothetical protein n=1 Tax=Streptomyces sp. NPDC019208 TaxID=3154683 RepID=UPI0033CFC690
MVKFERSPKRFAKLSWMAIRRMWGSPPGAPMFPIAVNLDGSWGIFLIDVAEIAEERYWWTGEGDEFFFTGFADVLTFLNNPGSFAPRETLL